MEKYNSLHLILLAIFQICGIAAQTYEYQFSHDHPQSYQHVPKYSGHYPPASEHQFSRQQQQIEAALENFNRHQMQSLQNEIHSIHNENSGPHFDFVVNQNYSDLEKASEQFVDAGTMLSKQKNAPKVIKITKTVAVKVPVIKYVPYLPQKEVMTPEKENYHVSSTMSSYKDEMRPDLMKYMPSAKPIIPPTTHTTPTPIHHNSYNFDTRPFYVRDPNDPKTMIKYIPTPVFEHGNDNHHHQVHHPQPTPANYHTVSIHPEVYPTSPTYSIHNGYKIATTPSSHHEHVQYVYTSDSYPSSTVHVSKPQEVVYQPQIKYVYQ